MMIRRLGGDPTAAMAGLGIGGIAVALAAQKTLENVIGGLSLIFDRAVCVGDFLKVGEATGTVDSIGLRSTRIRTPDRTILSVPNGQIANVSIETISSRDMFWFRHVLGLRCETTPVQLRAVVAGIVRQLGGHPAVDPESIRAKFFRFGPSSLDIEVVAYLVARDWSHFLDIQQELLLGILEVVELADTAIALPAQTLHLAGATSLAGAVLQATGRRADGT
jgi:MscS family membrane protein